MPWTDQEKLDRASLLFGCSVAGISYEFERCVHEGKRFYRFTAGNFFGSQSTWFGELEDALKVAQEIKQRHAAGRMLPVGEIAQHGVSFIQLEDRDE